MSKVKVSISMSLDGYVAGPDQSEKNPLGIGGEQLHEWVVPLRAFRESHGREGGEVNASTPIAEGVLGNVGATIMGRNMFGGGPGPWGDDSWKGWWGDDPPFHNPVFVLPTTRASRRRCRAEPPSISSRMESSRPSSSPGSRRRQGRVCRRCGRCAAVSGGGPAGRDPRLDRPHRARRRRTAVRQPGRPEARARASRGDRGAWSHAHQIRACVGAPLGIRRERPRAIRDEQGRRRSPRTGSADGSSRERCARRRRCPPTRR